MSVDMSPVVFTADFVGEPGRRTFYLQARGEGRMMTLLLEKEQVVLLAQRMRELLLLIDAEDTVLKTPPARDPVLGLVEPIEPEARVGAATIDYLGEDRVLVALEAAGEDAADDAAEDDTAEYRLLLRRDQVRSFVLHALATVAEGRPTCQLCGLPMDPSGHNCPASNGHRPVT